MSSASEAEERQYLWYFRMYGDRVTVVRGKDPPHYANSVMDGGEMLMIRVVAPDYEIAKLEAADKFGDYSREQLRRRDR